MRTLVVAYEYPWPTNSGSRIRLTNTLHGLSLCGDVDLFSIVSDQRSDFEEGPAAFPLRRQARVAIRDVVSPADLAKAAVFGHVPFEIPLRERPRISRALADFTVGRYDLVWCFRVRAWVLSGPPAIAPTVVDLDDLEDQKIRARMSLESPEPPGSLSRLRRRMGSALSQLDARRWRRLHARIASDTAATVVCSELDAKRAGLAGMRVVPNGYEEPPHPVGRSAVGSPPTVVFHGTLRYPPNADAARYLVRQVLPILETLVPDVKVRLVGLAPPEVARLDDVENVTVTGQVPDVTTELSKADVVAVPLRFASGTRVKILEAFAHRIPVVSTTIGAEGLDVEPGVHLLVADDPEGFAKACARLLAGPTPRVSMAEAAHELFSKHYESGSMRQAVAALASELAAS